jgi:predicted metalloprotease with PDZ domain
MELTLRLMAVSAMVLATLGPPAIGQARAAPASAILLTVDATDVNRGIFQVRETVPVARAGRLVLRYPKWLPGYHAPAGPIDKLGGLKMSAHGRPLSWTRDPADVYAFHVEVPAGVRAVELNFQYLSPVTPQQGRVVMTADILALEWHTVVLYPPGRADRIDVVPRVILPSGWRYATSLEVSNGDGTAISFQPVKLDVLVDSPLYAGRNSQRVDLDVDGESRVWLNLFADRPAQLDLSEAQVNAYRNLVRQADRLFGARPFPRYEFLVTLSNRLGGYGLEHRRSSENSISAGYLLEWDRSAAEERTLLPHEYVHSWNAKFRRSAGLMTPDLHTPVNDTMLWMYEGLSEYWGMVLTARSGLRTQQQALDALAALAAFAEHRTGRNWRSLSDTTHDPIIGRNAPLPWPNWQRGGDYYPEGPMLWLDIDTRIRELSGSRRSLDDFALLFFGKATATGATIPYDFQDVVAALNQVQPHDWSALLKRRLTGSEAPLDGLRRGGWRLIYKSESSGFAAATDSRSGIADFAFSLGFKVGPDGVLQDVMWGSPAFDAGLTIGTRLMAIDGVAYSGDELKRAVDAASKRAQPLTLLVMHGDRYRTVEIDYRGGLRYPHLERLPEAPDLLGAIFAPRD